MVLSNVKRKSCTDWTTFLNEGKGSLFQLHGICNMTTVFSESKYHSEDITLMAVGQINKFNRIQVLFPTHTKDLSFFLLQMF